WRLDDVITRADILGLIARQEELNFEPGSEHVYSNSGYTLLAETVFRVTGRTFREWTGEAVFAPLGMTDTHAHDDHRMIVRNRAESYQRVPGGGYRRSPLNYSNVGATSLFTTVGDLALWASNLLDPRFAPDVIAQMAEPTELTTGAPLTYGFGLGLRERDGRRVIEHGGADAGFRSHFAVFPDDDLAIVVLSNAAEVGAGQLAHRAARVLLESRRPIDVSNEVSSAPSGEPDPAAEPREPADVDISEEDLEPLTGYYWSARADLVRSIRLDRGSLWYQRGPGNSTRLRYVGGSVFHMIGVDPSLEVRFEATDQAVDAMVVQGPGDPPLRFERIDPVGSPIPFGDYEGVYVSDEVGVSLRVLVIDGGLSLRHPRHGTSKLQPVAADRFSSPEWWLGSLRFTRDGDGAVDGFRSTSGRVRNLRFRRDDSLGEPSRFRMPPPR
ncbi:MAG: serine hydrolase, partial [Gemmatimonadota bacterium]|nr:serine hydrolase [Gemmatimonadota bacterium]